MPSLYAPDGTELAYHVRGEGASLVCLPGGPGRASARLGDLGGLSAFVVQPGAGHYPWPDDPKWFVSTVTAFLDNENSLAACPRP